MATRGACFRALNSCLGWRWIYYTMPFTNKTISLTPRNPVSGRVDSVQTDAAVPPSGGNRFAWDLTLVCLILEAGKTVEEIELWVLSSPTSTFLNNHKTDMFSKSTPLEKNRRSKIITSQKCISFLRTIFWQKTSLNFNLKNIPW